MRQNILTYIFWLFGGNSTHSCNHGSSQFPKIKLFPLNEIISVMRDNVCTYADQVLPMLMTNSAVSATTRKIPGIIFIVTNCKHVHNCTYA